ncbi:GH24695 [Drosophila grimshawi]|uniref:GH24695 n=1 Tax=Drosophila grimshawi TaxID=7222 RepID=B4JMU6_DROGR|nr:GH24695 [Drosophila grimshawi]
MANAKVVDDAANSKRKLKTLSHNHNHTSSTNPPVTTSHPIQRTVAAAASKQKSTADGEKVDLARLPQLRNNVPQATAAAEKQQQPTTTTVALSSRRLAYVD